MADIEKNPLSKRKILYAILTGVLLTASFPLGGRDWVAWFALVPLLKSIDDEPHFNGFKLGFIAGFIHYLTLIYWIVVVLGNYGELNIVISFSILILLCLYLALFPGLFSFLVRYMKGTRFRILIAASIWVSLEYLRANILTGFPWCLLGYTQFENLTLIQISALVGVYGLSFLIVISNALIHRLFFQRSILVKKRHLLWEVPVILIFAFFTLVYGHYRLSSYSVRERSQKSLNVAIIQGNIDQFIKWNDLYQEKTIDLYHQLTRKTYGFKPDLIVWPETSVPFFFQDKSRLSMKVLKIAKESKANIIFGSPAYRREGMTTKYYNRAYQLSPTGKIPGYYDKVHLVPFGEYVPLKRFLPFVHRLVPAAGDFSSGEEIVPLRFPSLSAGILICFEAIFPELARSQVKQGADILVNLTNDAWFGMTSAPHQHLSMSVFRAVENQRPLIRAANTGFSAFINPLGKITTRGDLFTEEVLEQKVTVSGFPLTCYARYGDLFAIAILVICLLKFFYILCYHLYFGKKR
jgi:apolipoprotein N-acyltransferase